MADSYSTRRATIYESLENDNVRFFQGTQTDLNKYLPSSTDATKKGKAIEGAFYLTTDTHRLYVARKVTGGTAVYPEEVSSGISVVKDTGSLPNSASGEARDGDLYYIQQGDILAAFKATYDTTTGLPNGGSWVQLNSATGITNISRSVAEVTSSGVTTVTYSDSITTSNNAGGMDSTILAFKEGNNISLSDATPTGGNPTIQISATDTLYSIDTSTNASGGTITLSPDTIDAAHVASSVTLTGTGTTKVTSDNLGEVTIAGLTFTDTVNNSEEDIGVTAENNATGFTFGLDYKNGGSSTVTSITHYQKSTIDPQLKYGETVVDNETVNQVVHFSNGIADLTNIYYTKTEANAAINSAIDTKIAAANAMTYKGVISSLEALLNAISTNGAKIGDTYKATASFQLTGGRIVNIGDLIIVNSSDGTEQANGTIDTSKITYDIVPSGDEPCVESYASVSSTANGGATGGTATVIGLQDSKANNASLLNTIWTGKASTAVGNLAGTGKILVTSYNNNQNANAPHDVTVAFDHDTVTRSNSSTTALSSGTLTDGVDDLGTSTVQLFLMSSHSGLITDSTGHVTGVNGKTINFKHNVIQRHEATVGASTALAYASRLTGANYGTIALDVKDAYSSQPVSASFNIKSDSLKITQNYLEGDTDLDNTSLHINIVWESF